MEQDPGLPRAIVHVDGDAFFASCEVAKNPALRGKPVVTGKERGIVSAATYEAKRLGITRGVPLKEVKKICPETVILSSDYETYGIYSRRMYAIVRRYAPIVEEYGIDECFAEITNSPYAASCTYEQIAQRIKEDLYRELRMTFSVGVAPTKVLAKVGSKYKKPDGLTVITLANREQFLAETPLRDVWGIGPSMTLKLFKKGLDTALDFVRVPEGEMRDFLDRPHLALYRELRGEPVLPLTPPEPDAPHSIQTTRTFTPASIDRNFVLSQLSKNVEIAARKARRIGRAPGRISFHLKTQSFEYQSGEVILPHPSAAPNNLIPPLLKAAKALIRPGIAYRATGVALYDFRPTTSLQLDFWQDSAQPERLRAVYAEIDALSLKYGTPVVHVASSMVALEDERERKRQNAAFKSAQPFIRGLGHKRFSLPVLGEVS